MPTITDLTDTTWLFNNQISMSPLQGNEYKFNFNFYLTVDSTPGAGFDMTTEDTGLYLDYINIDAAYYDDTWQDNNFKSITITGGTDVTNTNLIVWLQANATQVQSHDLSNTHWKLNNNITFTNVGTKSINFKSGNTNFSSITINTTNGLKYDNTTIVEAPSGFSGSISDYTTTNLELGWIANTYIKFDTPPSSSNNYDNSSTVVRPLSGSTTYTNKQKIYVWTDSNDNRKAAVKINNVETTTQNTWNRPEEITLTGNYTIYLGNGSGYYY